MSAKHSAVKSANVLQCAWWLKGLPPNSNAELQEALIKELTGNRCHYCGRIGREATCAGCGAQR